MRAGRAQGRRADLTLLDGTPGVWVVAPTALARQGCSRLMGGLTLMLRLPQGG